jgi:hypothetical protein
MAHGRRHRRPARRRRRAGPVEARRDPHSRPLSGGLSATSERRPRPSAFSTRCPTTLNRRPAPHSCDRSAASCVRRRPTASKPRSPVRSSWNSTATRRSS